MTNLQFRPQQFRRLVLCLTTALAGGLICSATAHATDLPYGVTPDENGVDLASGDIVISEPAISFGSDGNTTLSYQRTVTMAGGFRHNLMGDIRLTTATSLELEVGSLSRTFGKANGVWTPAEQDGGSLVETTSAFVYTDASGVVTSFVKTLTNASYQNNNVVAVLGTLQRPTGERHDYLYKSVLIANQYGGTPSYAYRLVSVSSTSGYQIHFEYASDLEAPGYNDLQQWWSINKVSAFNLATDYCVPSALRCATTSNNVRSVSYPSWWYTDSTSNFQDGTTITYGGESINNPDGTVSSAYVVRRNSDSATQRKYLFDQNGRVSSVLTDRGVWTYSFDIDYSSGSRTAPDGGTIGFYWVPCGKLATLTDQVGNSTQLTYDTGCRVTSVMYPEGNKESMTYDARGNLIETKQIPKAGSGLANVIVSASYPATCTSPVLCNRPTWTRDALGNQTDYTYDGTTGLILTQTAPAPTAGAVRPQVRYTYAQKQAYYLNGSGQVVASAQNHTVLTEVSQCITGASCAGTADEQKTVYGYGAQQVGSANNLIPVTVITMAGDGSVSATVSSVHDAAGNRVSVDGPLAGADDTYGYRYDVMGNLIGAISPDPDGSAGPRLRLARRITYTDGVPTRVEEGSLAAWQDVVVVPASWTGFTLARSAETTYDGYRRVTSTRVKAADGTVVALTQHNYDASGRPSCTAQRMDPAQWGGQTDPCVPQTTGPAGPDRVTRRNYDAAGRVSLVTSAVGTAAVSKESTSYTANGRVASVRDGQNNLTTYEYDGLDRLLKTRFPLPAQGSNSSSLTDYEQMTYDAASNITVRRLRDGATITFSYDGLGRLASRTPSAENAVSYSYNLLGAPIQLQRPGDGATLTFGYDPLGRLTSTAQPAGLLTYQYDTAGRRTRMTWSDGLFAGYDYDLLGNVTAIRENGATTGVGVLASYAYDSFGRRTGVTYGNGTSRTYGWDNAGRPAGLKLDLVGTANDMTIGQAGGSGTAITYNPAFQMGTISRSNDGYAWTESYNISRSYTVNGLNQLTSAGAATIGYDGRGNLISSGTGTNITTFGYSRLNELTAVSGARNVTLGYDPLGRLQQSAVSGAVTKFLYDGGMITGEYGSSGNLLRRYVPGPGIDEPVLWYEGSGTGDRRWLQADERGSVISISDASGASIAINRYDEFGIPQSSNVGRFQYTGQAWLPEVGLYYYKARFYSPTLGRFMQTDPIGYQDGLNWYNYAGADPVNNTDPSGLFRFCRPAALYRNSTGVVASNREVCMSGFDNGWIDDSMERDLQQQQQEEQEMLARKAWRRKTLSRKLPGCLQIFLRGRLQSNPADITLHRGSPFDLTGNSVTFGNDINLAGNMFDRTDRGAEIHKFHEIQHTSQYARGYTTLNQAFAYVAFGGHDASPFEQAADKFAQDTYDAYKAAGLDKTCPF